MIKTIVGWLAGAGLSALVDYFRDTRAERKLREDLRKLGRLEERDDAYKKLHEMAETAARIKHRIATDPAYRERVRRRFTTSKR